MKINTSELTSKALDYAVAMALKLTVIQVKDGAPYTASYPKIGGALFAPSTDPALAHPIIEQESICLDKPEMSHQWIADKRSGVGRLYRQYGPTLLIAAMRCFVASKLGDIVELPDELLDTSS